ncbi:MAG: hypothetical protein MR775_05145 [Erysipelotrichaceae bacterium]|nr:hypothetical protein [Erysipelotrichaceae bacterium]
MEETNYTHREFTINSMKDTTFRVAAVSPVDMLAISYQVNLENYAMTKTTLLFALENLEVKVGDKWLPVKVKGREVYQPLGIDKNFVALNELFMWFLSEVITKLFPVSNE